jgi:hypothetical protein
LGRRRLPAAAIEEGHVSGSSAFTRHLRLATDDVILRVGRGLSPEELHYLRAVIVGALRR